MYQERNICKVCLQKLFSLTFSLCLFFSFHSLGWYHLILYLSYTIGQGQLSLYKLTLTFFLNFCIPTSERFWDNYLGSCPQCSAVLVPASSSSSSQLQQWPQIKVRVGTMQVIRALVFVIFGTYFASNFRIKVYKYFLKKNFCLICVGYLYKILWKWTWFIIRSSI